MGRERSSVFHRPWNHHHGLSKREGEKGEGGKGEEGFQEVKSKKKGKKKKQEQAAANEPIPVSIPASPTAGSGAEQSSSSGSSGNANNSDTNTGSVSESVSARTNHASSDNEEGADPEIEQERKQGDFSTEASPEVLSTAMELDSSKPKGAKKSLARRSLSEIPEEEEKEEGECPSTPLAVTKTRCGRQVKPPSDYAPLGPRAQSQG